MQKLFGNYDSTHHWAIWKPNQVPSAFSTYFEDGRGRASLEYDKTYTEGKTTKRFVVFSTVPDSARGYDCHQCNVLLSEVIFIVGKGELPETREDFLVAGGGWGHAPELTFKRLGHDHIALAVSDITMQGGVSEGALRLFAERNGTIRQVLALRQIDDNTDLDICVHPKKGNAKDCRQDPSPMLCFDRRERTDKEYRELCTSWVGSLKVLNPTRSTGWSDLKFKQRVLAATPGAFTHKTYVTHFRFTDKTYLPQPPLPRGPRIDLAYYSDPN